MPERKIRICNKDTRTQTLWLEPWAEDYWLRPDEEFDIIARSVDEAFYFHVDFGNEIVVYAEGQVTDIGVYHAGSLLQCGHQRVGE
jgi:hypothetical protein